jgi:hypothetical protein
LSVPYSNEYSSEITSPAKRIETQPLRQIKDQELSTLA